MVIERCSIPICIYDMYVFIYIYISKYMYIYIYLYVHRYLHVNVYTYIYMYIHNLPFKARCLLTVSFSNFPYPKKLVGVFVQFLGNGLKKI